MEDEDSDPSKREDDITIFVGEVLMLSKLKRRMLKRRLKMEKLDLLAQVVSINKKLKAIEDLDKEVQKRRKDAL